MDFMLLRLNSSSFTCSIFALATILQLVAIENQKLHMVDLPTYHLNKNIPQPEIPGGEGGTLM